MRGHPRRVHAPVGLETDGAPTRWWPAGLPDQKRQEEGVAWHFRVPRVLSVSCQRSTNGAIGAATLWRQLRMGVHPVKRTLQEHRRSVVHRMRDGTGGWTHSRPCCCNGRRQKNGDAKPAGGRQNRRRAGSPVASAAPFAHRLQARHLLLAQARAGRPERGRWRPTNHSAQHRPRSRRIRALVSSASGGGSRVQPCLGPWPPLDAREQIRQAQAVGQRCRPVEKRFMCMAPLHRSLGACVRCRTPWRKWAA